VNVAGVAAYSTLGHFDDPILNTMIGWNDVELASIIFHELTHQMIYIANDADFNEALATTVEEEGVRRWLESLGRSAELERYELEEQRSLEVVTLLSRTREELRVLYGSGLDPVRMRERKAAAFAALRDSYAQLVQGWGPHPPFESWFEKGEVNNAYLASIATYYDCVPGFRRELAAVGPARAMAGEGGRLTAAPACAGCGGVGRLDVAMPVDEDGGVLLEDGRPVRDHGLLQLQRDFTVVREAGAVDRQRREADLVAVGGEERRVGEAP